MFYLFQCQLKLDFGNEAPVLGKAVELFPSDFREVSQLAWDFFLELQEWALLLFKNFRLDEAGQERPQAVAKLEYNAVTFNSSLVSAP